MSPDSYRTLAIYVVAFTLASTVFAVLVVLTVLPGLVGTSGMWLLAAFSVLANLASLALPVLEWVQRRRRLDDWQAAIDAAHASVAAVNAYLASK